jgi:hypothetical protein
MARSSALAEALRPFAEKPSVGDGGVDVVYMGYFALVCCEAGPIASFRNDLAQGCVMARFGHDPARSSAHWETELESALEEWRLVVGARCFSAWWMGRSGWPLPDELSPPAAPPPPPPTTKLRLLLERALLRVGGGYRDAWRDATMLALERRRSSPAAAVSIQVDRFLAPLLVGSPTLAREALRLHGLSSILPRLTRADAVDVGFWSFLSRQLLELPREPDKAYVDVVGADDALLLHWPWRGPDVATRVRASVEWPPLDLGALLAAATAAARCLAGELALPNGFRYGRHQQKTPSRFLRGTVHFRPLCC